MIKNQINLKKLLQTVLLLVFVITWFNSASASVLCVGSDGHTSIENIYSSNCHHNEKSFDFEFSSQDDCQDTLLLNNSLNSSCNFSNDIPLPDIAPVNNLAKQIPITINKIKLCLDTNNQLINSPNYFSDSIRLII